MVVFYQTNRGFPQDINFKYIITQYLDINVVMQNRDFLNLAAGSSRAVSYHLEVEPSNNNKGFSKNAKEKRSPCSRALP